MEFIEDGKGGRIAIPDSVIAASTATAFHVKHGDKKKADVGVTVMHYKRDLVEKYIAADAKGREKIEAEANALLSVQAIALAEGEPEIAAALAQDANEPDSITAMGLRTIADRKN